MEEVLKNFIGNNIIVPFILAALPLGFLLGYALLAVLGEVKISAWMQDRLGPMRTGPWGILQPVADILKLIQKEDTMPYAADRKLYNLAPYIIFVGSFAAFAAIPFADQYVAANLNLGLFYILAISSFGVIGIIMAGWASNNKYSLFGAMRAVAQIVSYEVPAAMAILIIAMLVGSLNVQDVITAQKGGIWNWFIFGGPKKSVLLSDGNLLMASWSNIVYLPFLAATFLIHYISSLAETNRTPFDIPEAESELVAGYHTEYSGMKFAMFFLAEYANMFLVSVVSAILFFGGWQSPFGVFVGDSFGIPVLSSFESFFWLVSKGLILVIVMMWLRWTLPRLRVDQLMYMCWKVLIPFSFGIALIVGFLKMVL